MTTRWRVVEDQGSWRIQGDGFYLVSQNKAIAESIVRDHNECATLREGLVGAHNHIVTLENDAQGLQEALLRCMDALGPDRVRQDRIDAVRQAQAALRGSHKDNHA